MQLKLSDLEIELLRKLVNGEAVSISSPQRGRLELAGVIGEGGKGYRGDADWSRARSRKTGRGNRQRLSTRGQGLARWSRSANALSAQVRLLAPVWRRPPPRH